MSVVFMALFKTEEERRVGGLQEDVKNLICLLPLSDKKLPLYFGNVLTISIISGILPAKRA